MSLSWLTGLSWLTANWGWKLLSLGLSILLWDAVVREAQLVSFVTVPVQYRNMPRSLELSSETVDRVQLALRGPSSKLTAGRLSETAVVIDLSGVRQPGERSFAITQSNTTLPSGVFLTRAVPGQLRLVFEKQVSKEVPVEVRFDGPPPAGFRVLRTEVRPGKVRIIGPESRVQAIEAVQTDALDLTERTDKGVYRVNAYLADPQVRFAGSPAVTVAVDMGRLSGEGH